MSPDKPENKTSALIFTIGGIVACIAGCIAIFTFVTGYVTLQGGLNGLSSGPSDAEAVNLIQEHYNSEGNTRNFQVTSKGKCNVDNSSQADGVSEIWRVNFSYEMDVWGDNKWTDTASSAIIIKRNGSWEFVWGWVCR